MAPAAKYTVFHKKGTETKFNLFWQP